MSLKKALFIDRDGTIIVEPMPSEQVDSFEKFEFIPGAISALKSIAGLGYELVLATNQDGLGTDSFPYEDFIGPQELMLKTLRGEGVVFDDILIDRSFPADNLPTRKPGIGMFGKYLSGEYDLAASYVIGDRETDMKLAENLGCKAILLDENNTWADIAETLRRGERRATITRNTKETQITVTVDLDGGLETSISKGIPADLGMNTI